MRVNILAARTRLSQLVVRAQAGETVVITRHGKPVAQLIPFDEGDANALRQAIDKVGGIRASLARQGVTLSKALAEGETPRQLAHAGHRY